MSKKVFAAVLCFVMVCSTVVFSAPAELKMTKGRMAMSHDGNAYDRDDIYATAMDFAVMAAFGLQKKFVHMHHSVFQSNNDPSFHTKELEAAKGWSKFPGYNESFVLDAYNNMPACAAHFKVQAEQNSADDKLYFCLAGPMHVPFLCIQATTKEKRQFIHCISHSSANEGMKSGVSNGKTWADIKSTFGADKVTCEDIPDQNANLGGKGHGVWSWLDGGMTVKQGITLEAWKWLWSQDWKANGDCSDNGMMWYVLTGNNKATFADYKERFQDPLPMNTAIVTPSAKAVGASGSPLAITFSQNNKVLNVNVSGIKGNGSVSIYNLRSQQISTAPLSNGQAQLSLDRGTAGSYIMAVESQGQKVARQILLK